MAIERGAFTPPPPFSSRPLYAPNSCKSERRKSYYSTASPSPTSDRFHVIHKVPIGDSPYVRAKRVQLIEKDLIRSISLFWRAINSGDRVDSALKDMALVMKQLDRSDEAIEAIRSFRHLCSKEAQESLDNILIELYKRSGRMEEQVKTHRRRKRMSVIVETEEGKLLLLSKGADSVMFTMLAKGGVEYEEQTREHIHEYADAGLRTLVLAYREVSKKEYEEFNFKFSAARFSVSADRDAMIDQVAKTIEKDLILLSATAVEDKLQPGVPECIDKLAQAGIKIWVLTGDKMETAINIGFACSMLRQRMKQIIITLDAPEIKALEKEGKKGAIIKASQKSVLEQIGLGKHQVDASAAAAFALIAVN